MLKTKIVPKEGHQKKKKRSSNTKHLWTLPDDENGCQIYQPLKSEQSEISGPNFHMRGWESSKSLNQFRRSSM